MQLKVFKYEGAGNDFIALDGRSGTLPSGEDRAELVRALCDRRRGIGGDGALILELPENSGHDFRMVYLNSDGSLGEMCGNGARCIARFAHLMGAAHQDMTFLTDAGLYSGLLVGENVRISFPDIPSLPRGVKVNANGREWDCDFLEVGVPHLVVWVDDLDELDIRPDGRALRRHEEFAPRGTNVNFAQVTNDPDAQLRIRTYERGVEDETLACGTGSVASAVCHILRHNRQGKQNVRVVPTGGQELQIGLNLGAEGAKEVTLSGPARLTFVTVVSWHPAEKKITPFDFESGIR